MIIHKKVGADYRENVGGLRHLTCKEECPNLCSNQWQYGNNGWKTDHSINISCGKIR